MIAARTSLAPKATKKNRRYAAIVRAVRVDFAVAGRCVSIPVADRLFPRGGLPRASPFGYSWPLRRIVGTARLPFHWPR